MKILFHENQLSYRGTSNAVYNYARFNEELLNNESVILYQRNNKNNDAFAIEHFSKRFKTIAYDNVSELNAIAQREKADLFYAIKAGKRDGIEVSACKTAIHSVFQYYEPHGDVYAYVSQWLSNEMTAGAAPFVPHMIYVEPTDSDLREALSIPADAIVFGRHGGSKTFDLAFVKSVVRQVAKARKDLYFVFLGTAPFVFRSIFNRYRNIIFLPATVDENYKARFINTCDAYLHARKQGESFGIAVGEFSVCNKPIITWSGSAELSHLAILGDKALIYNGQSDLKELLLNFKNDPARNWDAYSKEYSPQKVMSKFKSVFID